MKERYRRYLKWCIQIIIGAAVLAAVFALMLECAFRKIGFALSPISWIRLMFRVGFPWKLWFLIDLLFLALIGTLAYTAFGPNREEDKLHRNFKMARKRQTYGEAHFEEPREYRNVAIIQNSKNAYGSIFGQLDDSGKYLIVQNLKGRRLPNLNKAVFGSAGVGKSYTYVKPECLQVIRRRESVIITDPDGGLFRDMATVFEKNGYVVRCLNLKDLQHSDGWNCMKAISPQTLTTDAAIFARTIIKNCSAGEEGIYKDGPESLLSALILRVFLGEDYQADEVNIKNAYQMVLNPSGEKYLDSMFDINQLSKEERPCLMPYQVFKQASPNLRGNIIVNLASSLNVLQDESLGQVLSTDDIDLELPGTRPCAYFCIFPDSHDTYKFVVSLFFSMLFIKLIALADTQPNGRLPVPVNFLLDEFANIGVLPDWDQKMATIRKRAISVTMILQNITQLQNNYDTAWWTILSNCATWLVLGVNDEETAKIISHRVGETTMEVQTEQHRPNESLFTLRYGHNTGEGRRSLLAVDELSKLGLDDNIIIFQGHNPILARKFPIDQHPLANQLESRQISEMPGVRDTAKRDERFRQEKERITAFDNKYPLKDVDRTYSACCVEEHIPTGWDHVREALQQFHIIIKEELNKLIHGEPGNEDYEFEVVTFQDPTSDEKLEDDIVMEEVVFEVGTPEETLPSDEMADQTYEGTPHEAEQAQPQEVQNNPPEQSSGEKSEEKPEKVTEVKSMEAPEEKPEEKPKEESKGNEVRTGAASKAGEETERPEKKPKSKPRRQRKRSNRDVAIPQIEEQLTIAPPLSEKEAAAMAKSMRKNSIRFEVGTEQVEVNVAAKPTGLPGKRRI